mgnify:CR=1 FL=1
MEGWTPMSTKRFAPNSPMDRVSRRHGVAISTRPIKIRSPKSGGRGASTDASTRPAAAMQRALSAEDERTLADPERGLREIEGGGALGRLDGERGVLDLHGPGEQGEEELLYGCLAIEDLGGLPADLAAGFLGVLGRGLKVPLQSVHASRIEAK